MAVRFKVIFMVRSLEETVASQEKMRSRLAGPEGRNVPPAELLAGLREHRQRVLEVLWRNANVDCLAVEITRLWWPTRRWRARVAAFVGLASERVPAMATVVAPKLRHFRQAQI